MIRRYIAFSLIVIFFAYAAYLIITDGGSEFKLIRFEKFGENIQNKFSAFTGNGKTQMTKYEVEQQKKLNALKAESETAKLNK